MPEVRIASVFYGPQEWKVRNGHWYVMMHGTNGPNQTPHWFWGEVAEHKVPGPVRQALKGN
jgi:hypothetical protein